MLHGVPISNHNIIVAVASIDALYTPQHLVQDVAQTFADETLVVNATVIETNKNLSSQLVFTSSIAVAVVVPRLRGLRWLATLLSDPPPKLLFVLGSRYTRA